LLAWPDTFVGVFRWIGIINVVLVVFNLIPGFPLDGGRVLRAALWHWKKDLRAATHAASRVGKAFGAVLIGLGILYLLTVNPIGGLWWILIGLFIRGAAKSSYQRVVLRDHLKGEPVRRFMNADPMAVSPSVPLDEFVEGYVYEHHYKMFPVVQDGQLQGCVHTRQVKDVPRDQWSHKTVGDVASPCDRHNSIAPDADAVDAFSRMNRSGNSRMIVARNGDLEGILALKDLMKFLSLKLDMEGEDASTARKIAQRGPVSPEEG
jgi:signal-transduction protein with cAMP-binding, CBS, and nucleotidyltransferase domain